MQRPATDSVSARHPVVCGSQCWSKDRTHRPKFKDLLEFFVGLLNGDVTALQRDYDHMHTSTGRNQSSSTSSSEGNYPSTSRDSGYDATPSDSSGGKSVAVAVSHAERRLLPRVARIATLFLHPPSHSGTWAASMTSCAYPVLGPRRLRRVAQ